MSKTFQLHKVSGHPSQQPTYVRGMSGPDGAHAVAMGFGQGCQNQIRVEKVIIEVSSKILAQILSGQGSEEKVLASWRLAEDRSLVEEKMRQN